MFFGLIIGLHPGDQLECSIHRLGNRCAAFHPVTGIDVTDTVNILHHRVVNVATDDAVDIVAACFIRYYTLELANEVDGMLDLKLCPGRERPVRKPDPATNGGQKHIDGNGRIICPVTQIGEQAGVADDHVEFVTMNDQIFLAVGRFMDHPLGHFDTAEVRAGKFAKEFVVVAGNVDDARSLAGLSQQLLDHVVAALRPVPVAAQAPAVDDITDENDRLGFMIAQEIQKEIRLGGFGAKMHIGNE